jgi:hypothetical protein
MYNEKIYFITSYDNIWFQVVDHNKMIQRKK